MSASRDQFLAEHLGPDAPDGRRERPVLTVAKGTAQPNSAEPFAQQADDLRAKARDVFLRQHGHPRRTNVERRVLARLPNSADSSIVVGWIRGDPKGRWRLDIRGFVEGPHGEAVAMRGVGLAILPQMLPGLAAAIARALDDLEPSATGLRVKETPAHRAGDVVEDAEPQITSPTPVRR